jgi:hypothetical protein
VPQYRPDLRRFTVGQYVLYYQPIQNGVRLVRVLYGARTMDDLLPYIDGTCKSIFKILGNIPARFSFSTCFWPLYVLLYTSLNGRPGGSDRPRRTLTLRPHSFAVPEDHSFSFSTLVD